MALRAILDSLEGLPEAIHEHYSEKDGKYYLDIDGDLRQHPKGASLQAAIDRLKKEKKDLTDKLKAAEDRLKDLPDDFTADELAALKDELEELKSKGGGGGSPDDDNKRAEQKRLLESRIANLEAKHKEEKDKLEATIKELTGQIEKLVADEGLTQALIKAGVDKKLMSGATALLRKSVKVRKDEDTGEWEAYFDTDTGESTIEDFVATWAQSDDGSVYVTPAKGGGAGGGDGKQNGYNPFVNDPKNGVKPNLQKQQELLARDPVRARQLAAAAGVQLPAGV